MTTALPTIALRTHTGSLQLQAPPDFARLASRFFGLLREPVKSGDQAIVLTQTSGGQLSAQGNRANLGEARSDRTMLVDLARHILGHTGALTPPKFAIFGATLAWEQNQVLLISHLSLGKTSLAAWLIEQGFSYSGDGVAILDAGERTVSGLPGPLLFHADSTEHLAQLETFKEAPSVLGNTLLAVAPGAGWSGAGTSGPLKLVVYVTHGAKDSLDVKALEPALAANLLTSALVAPHIDDAQKAMLENLVEDVPVIALRYSAYGELTDLADHLFRTILTEELPPAAVRRFVGGLAGSAAPAAAAAPAASGRFPVPAATPRQSGRKLTIAMATYDDYDGVYFSIQAVRMFHPEVAADVDFLVLDNHPDGPCGEALKRLENQISNYRYVPVADQQGTWTRYRAFGETDSRSVMCIDSHVYVAPGAIARLIAHLDADPQARDMLQGPLMTDDFKRVATHMEPGWRGGFYGKWEFQPAAEVPADAPPFDIPMQGMGLFACHRAAWPGVNPRFSGFGAEEFYVQEKFRQHGGRVLCLPFLRWLHRFERPMGVPFRNTWEDRVRNYLIGHAELGLPLAPVRSHFSEFLGQDFMDRVDRDLAAETP